MDGKKVLMQNYKLSSLGTQTNIINFVERYHCVKEDRKQIFMYLNPETGMPFWNLSGPGYAYELAIPGQYVRVAILDYKIFQKGLKEQQVT